VKARIAVIVPVVLLGACGVHRTSLAHPGVTGSIEDVAVVRNDFFAERRLNLEHGALDDTVRLIRFDAEAICFHAITRSLAEERNVASLAGPSSELTMEANGHEMIVTEVLAAPVERGAVTGTEYVAQGTGQYESVCVETTSNGYCLRYEQQEITQSVAVAVDHDVNVQSSLLCFTNDGTITPHTSSVELRLGRAHFGFELVDPAPEGAAWARDPIVANGYAELLGVGSAGGQAPVTAQAQSAPVLPADLASIPVHPMRIADPRGRVAIEVDASGIVSMNGAAAARIEGGAIYDADGVVQMALGRDGSVWALAPDRTHYVIGATIDDRGRVSSADGAVSMTIDRRGAIVESRAGAHPRTSAASFAGRLRTDGDRTLGALLVLIGHDQLSWR
jgi:hypothetical protein